MQYTLTGKSTDPERINRKCTREKRAQISPLSRNDRYRKLPTPKTY